MTLAQQVATYTEWRTGLVTGLETFRKWLAANDLSDAQSDLRINQLLEKLKEDRLNIAFVAEFSRGKSELINAIFFADYGNRMLPSTAGRTTMCPTELMFDPAKPPSIDLLPIETRETGTSISEYKQNPEAWTTLPLEIAAPESMQQTLRSVSDVRHVTPDIAEKYGFADPEGNAVTTTEDGTVEIPRWRHAIINFPHPLLQQGLVILDTPGLNAIGTEPELTLSLLPNAHAVLFILAADTGVTQSDLSIWHDHVEATGQSRKGRIIALNKIDGLWDELKTAEEIESEIARQVQSCANILNVKANQVFPISAQKALVAKVNGDNTLLAQSRLAALESALSAELIPSKQEIIEEVTKAEFTLLATRVQELLSSRLSGLQEQLQELSELRGKNKGVVEYMMRKVHTEKEEFETGLQRFAAVRSIFTQLTNKLFGHLGLDTLRNLTTHTRAAMNAANFSKDLSAAMHHFFSAAHENLNQSEKEVGEILAMLEAIYKKFVVEHGLTLGSPTGFSLTRHRKELKRLEKWCDTNLNTVFSLATKEKSKVTQRFFEEVTSQVRRTFERANREAEDWIKAVMAPMETQVREHQIQLKRRLESIKRIHQATDTLEERIAELAHVEEALVVQRNELDALCGHVHAILSAGSHRLPEAA